MKVVVVSLLAGLVTVGALADKPRAPCKDAAHSPTFGDAKPQWCTTSSLREIADAKRQQELDDEAQRKRRAQARADAVLVSNYPDRAAFDAAQQSDVAPMRERLVDLEARREELLAARKPLNDRLEFFRPPHKVPGDLQSLVDENSARLAAAQAASRHLEQQLVEVSKRWEKKLAQLQKLWEAQGATG